MKQLFYKYGIDINTKQIEQFDLYYKLLVQWNEKMNLTTITEYEDVIKKHFLDSCLLLKEYKPDRFEGKRVIDVGTGAGFPGIPLAIMIPEASFTLMDSLNKRIEFLKEVCSILKLEHVSLFHGRAEEMGQDIRFREQYDFCVSRAVANLPLLLEYCSPFVKKEGYLFLYKSKKTNQEIEEGKKALEILNCSVSQLMELAKEPDYERYLLEIVKNSNTPQCYPRKAGKPKKRPL